MTPMNDIKKMNDKELTEFLREKREAVRGARFNTASRDVRAVRTAKKDIARAETERTHRMREAVNG